MAHEIALGDGVEWCKGHHRRVQSTLRQESLHPSWVKFHESLRGCHANFFRIDPTESFASFDEMPQVSRRGGCTHAAQRFDGLHAKIVGSFGQKISFRHPQKL